MALMKGMKGMKGPRLQLVCSLLLLCCSMQVVWAECSEVTREEERNALVEFFEATEGWNWKEHAGWLEGEDYCGWHGVTCDSENNVKFLTMEDNNVIGTVPSSLKDLQCLTILDLNQNEVDLSPGLDTMPSLMYMLLDRNVVTSIPPALARSPLGFVMLNDNMIEDIPTFNTPLVTLELARNRIRTIPGSIANITSLVNLDLSFNNITAFPDVFYNLTDLTTLKLHHNPLGTTIPPSIGFLSSLNTLDLSYCELYGHLPSEMAKLSSLTNLVISNNEISSISAIDILALPFASLRDMTLQVLMIHDNMLRGTIPLVGGPITVYNARNNPFGSTFPPFFQSAYDTLAVLDLGNCSLQGALPEMSKDLIFPPSLSYIDLSDNPDLYAENFTFGDPWWLSPVDGQTILHADPDEGFPFVCPAITLTEVPTATVVVSKSLRIGCTCTVGFYGNPLVVCKECDGICGAVCTQREGVSWNAGTFPIFSTDDDDDDRIDGELKNDIRTSKLLGFLDCERFSSACNPLEECEIGLFGPIECSQEEWCSLGYEGRLCSRCSPSRNGECYYLSGSACVAERDGPPRWRIVLFLMLVATVGVVYNATIPGVRAGYRRGFTFFTQTSSTINGQLFQVGVGTVLSALTKITNGGMATFNAVELEESYIHTSQVRCWYDWMHEELSMVIISLASPLLWMIPCVVFILFCRLCVVPRIAELGVFVRLKLRITRIVNRWKGVEDYSATDHDIPFIDDEEDEVEANEILPKQHEAVRWDARNEASAAHKIVSSVMFILYEAHYAATLLCLSLLHCVREEVCGTYSGRSYVQSMPWLQCQSSDYGGYFTTALIGLSIYTAAVPLLFIAAFVRFRAEIVKSRSHVHGWLGWMYLGYKPEYWWFEGVWAVRRLALAFIVSVVPDNDGWQTSSIMVILTASILIHHIVQPYQFTFENYLEICSLSVLAGSYAVQQILYTEFTHTTEGVWVLLVPNIIVLLCYVIVIIRETGGNVWKKFVVPLYRFVRLVLANRSSQRNLKAAELTESEYEDI